MKKLLLVSVFAAFVAVSPVSAQSVSAKSDEPVVFERFVVTGKPSVPKGIVLEKVNGAPPTWKLVGFTKEMNVRVAILSDGSSELRRMDPDSFVFLPPVGASFKLAQIDGKGKYLPVDLANIDGKTDGRLAWVLVTE